MPAPELSLPVRLQAAGGMSAPDPRVLRALGSPLVGQFDPSFTVVMDEVIQLAREVFDTRGPCVPVSGLAEAGLEAVLTSLFEPDLLVGVVGDSAFQARVAQLAARRGALARGLDLATPPPGIALVVASLLDLDRGAQVPLAELAAWSHARGADIVVDASDGLGAVECSVDAWSLDAVVAGVEGGLGGAAGLSLVALSPALDARLQVRRTEPPTSFLDLRQLQAYWSPARLNHHTAPTALVYGLREALRLVVAEGLPARVARHAAVADLLRTTLAARGHRVRGVGPVLLVGAADAAAVRRRLRHELGIEVGLADPHTLRIGLLGADAEPPAAHRLLAALAVVLGDTA
jgi:(S)-ureidoglycine-glyoxylate aminotransferase